MSDPSSPELILLIEMLERIGLALLDESGAPRVNRQKIGGHGQNLLLIGRQLRTLEPSQGET